MADVQVLGTLAEANTLLEIASSDVLIMASFMEGLPVVLTEAMGLGLPVIAPRLAGIPELVVDRHNGLLFSPSDWRELAELICELFNDPNLRQRLGRAGQDSVRQSFDVLSAIHPLRVRFSGEIHRTEVA